jgi:AcrR family transcriptional regulator
MQVKQRSRKAQQADATRALLLAAARRRFGEAGYTATSIDEVAADVGVTIGALYHHFRDKRALFSAVYEQVEEEVADGIIAGMRERLSPGASAWDEVRAGSHAFLDACQDTAVQRVILIEAPVVLGSDVRKQLTRHGLEMIRNGLRRAIDQRLIEPQPIEPMAHILRAALTEAAVHVARSEDQPTARAEAAAAIDRLLSGLRTPQHP